MHREVSLRVVQAPIIGVQRHNGTMSSLRSSIIPETAVPTTLDQPTTSFATSEVPRPTYAQAVAGSTANAGYSGAQRSAHAYGKNATWQNEKQASKSTSSANAAHREHSAKRARYNSNSASPPRPYPRSTSPASTVDAELAANANYQLGAQPATQTVGAWNLVSKLPGDRLTQNLATTHLLPPPTSTHASPTASSVSSGRSARRTQEEMRSSPALHRCSCGCGFDSVVNLKYDTYHFVLCRTLTGPGTTSETTSSTASAHVNAIRVTRTSCIRRTYDATLRYTSETLLDAFIVQFRVASRRASVAKTI